MPLNKDTSPNIKWPLPEGKPSIFLDSVFPENILLEIKETIKNQAVWGPGSETKENASPYHTILGRWQTEIKFSNTVWDYLENLGKEKWGIENLRLKTIWLSRYQQYQGITPYLWEHMDQPATHYTADICIESPGVPSWGLIVDGEKFEEKENSGILFMGQQQTHSRPPYPVDDKDAYVVVLFANYATPDHWVYDLDCYSDEGNEKYREAMDKYKLDGDIRYYEHTGHAPSFHDMPKTNYTCKDCMSCLIVEPDFVEKIPGYVKLK